ncbi:MAG: histidine triad nucleotide-binding protein [Patescibacteria group bacterium]
MEDIFCRIVKKEVPSKIVFENEKILVIEDIAPKAPVHILIIPKKHISSADELKSEDKELVGEIFLIAPQIAKEKGIADTGYRVVMNKGKDAGQTVDHLHFHLLGGHKLPFA